MPSDDKKAGRGVLVEAENGAAIEYDETGLVLHLSDIVVTDLARRLGRLAPAITTSAAEQPEAALVRQVERLDPAVLGDIDAWDVTRSGDWFTFAARLPGAEGPRRYLRHAAGGGIVAETGGPVLGILGLGGGRQATTWSGAPRFPHHVVSCPPPHEGEPDRPVVTLRHRSADSELADALIAVRHQAYRRLPLVVTGHELVAPGPLPVPDAALDALDVLLDRMSALAGAFGKDARLLALRVEPGPDNAPTDAEAFHRDWIALLDRLAERVAGRDLGALRFLTVADCGAWWQNDADANRPALEGFHRLALRPGMHQLIVAAAGYMFAQDGLGQPTPEAASERADMEAHALEAALARQDWVCPLMCLAEREGDVIRATFKTAGPLVIDHADPFGAGPGAGFALAGTEARVASVEIAPDDPGAVLIRLDGALLPAPGGHAPRLDYAIGGPMRDRTAGELHAPACGALRDDWQAVSRTGRALHRWALPGSIEIR